MEKLLNLSYIEKEIFNNVKNKSIDNIKKEIIDEHIFQQLRSNKKESVSIDTIIHSKSIVIPTEFKSDEQQPELKLYCDYLNQLQQNSNLNDDHIMTELWIYRSKSNDGNLRSRMTKKATKHQDQDQREEHQDQGQGQREEYPQMTTKKDEKLKPADIQPLYVLHLDEINQQTRGQLINPESIKIHFINYIFPQLVEKIQQIIINNQLYKYKKKLYMISKNEYYIQNNKIWDKKNDVEYTDKLYEEQSKFNQEHSFYNIILKCLKIDNVTCNYQISSDDIDKEIKDIGFYKIRSLLHLLGFINMNSDMVPRHKIIKAMKFDTWIKTDTIKTELKEKYDAISKMVNLKRYLDGLVMKINNAPIFLNMHFLSLSEKIIDAGPNGRASGHMSGGNNNNNNNNYVNRYLEYNLNKILPLKLPSYNNFLNNQFGGVPQDENQFPISGARQFGEQMSIGRSPSAALPHSSIATYGQRGNYQPSAQGFAQPRDTQLHHDSKHDEHSKTILSPEYEKEYAEQLIEHIYNFYTNDNLEEDKILDYLMILLTNRSKSLQINGTYLDKLLSHISQFINTKKLLINNIMFLKLSKDTKMQINDEKIPRDIIEFIQKHTDKYNRKLNTFQNSISILKGTSNMHGDEENGYGEDLYDKYF
jgi:hypothetical protein